jgi:mitogen-activated protein kinase 1/3
MENFNVTEHYKCVDVIGEGAYGLVVYVLFGSRTQLTLSSAIHLDTQTRVAIKKITPFDHPMFCQRTLREIKLLRHFR